MDELYTVTKRALKKIKWLESLEQPTYLNVDEAANAIRDYKRARRTAAKTTKAGRRHAGYAADIHERVTTGDKHPKGRRRRYFWQTKRWQDKAIGTGLAVGLAGAGLYATKGKKKKLFSRGEDGVIRLAKQHIADDDMFDVARNPTRHEWKISDTTPNTARVTSPHAKRRRRKKEPEETMDHQREQTASEKGKKGLWRAGAVTAATIGFIASRNKAALLKKAAKKLKKKGKKVKRVKRKAADALATEQSASRAALAKQKKVGIKAHEGEINKRVQKKMREDAAKLRAKQASNPAIQISASARHPDRIELRTKGRHGGKRESNLARWDEPPPPEALTSYNRSKPYEAMVGGAVGGVGTAAYTHKRMKDHAKVRDKVLTKKGKTLTKKGVKKAAKRRLTNVVARGGIGAGAGAVGALLVGRALARRRENYGK